MKANINKSLCIRQHHNGYSGSLSFFLTVFLLLSVIFPPLCAAASEPQYHSFDELSGKKVGMITGAPFEELVRSRIPDVGEIQYFSSAPDMSVALLNGRIDAYLMNNAVGSLIANRNDGIELFPESLGDTNFGIAFAKNSPERAKWQTAFDSIPQDKRLMLWDKWTGADDSIKTIPEQSWQGANGTVKAAVCDTLEPMCYVGADGQLIGFDIEMILLMAEKLDVHVEFTGMEFSSLMTEVDSGRALLGAGSIVVTEEREKSVDFVNYAPASFVLMVRSESGDSQKTGFFEKLSGSFERTFITDNRWKMLLSGLGVTVITAAASGALGTLIGFCLVFLRRRNNKAVNGLISVYSDLMSGIPAVVILMVLYYVIFTKADLPAEAVAICGFSLIFGARSFGVIQNAVNAVDSGQREAALALGFTEARTFREIILPQSRSIYFPILRTQLVMLLKETSIAGYITVLDLTRAGDLIRSRTMEAFFPLLVTAAVYFILTNLITKLFELIDIRHLAMRSRRRIKGVD
ncbi:MAG: ABC transporter permease subunit [Oscillospiraceae bacterium]|nr:ABC transporter permease subunit [Oscillospiraceae bacterium]